ncbi:MAG TPA: DUF192 domain-containing protein [Candidatus Nanoarchaeia archaeon]|nr:DUF192 domain-containing protein [Candidatus Nanoarchaeia archaeon]
MNFSFNFKNNNLKVIPSRAQARKIKISVKKVSWFRKGIGLMFLSRKKAKALLFEFEKSVKISFTSLFVFFPFVIIWLDSKNNVLDFRKVNPFELHIPSIKPFRRVLEVPFNNDYFEIIKKLVGKNI